jgi:SET domain-containing protein
VRPSLIHGKGLIAVRPIKRGEVVMIFGGTLFSREDIVAGKANTRTLMQIGEESWLGNRADEPLSEDYFINHSCDPDLWMQDEVTLTARRRITTGEEVTMDYAMHFADPTWTMRQPCSCGSSLCRGQIRGTDWMLDDLQNDTSNTSVPF